MVCPDCLPSLEVVLGSWVSTYGTNDNASPLQTPILPSPYAPPLQVKLRDQHRAAPPYTYFSMPYSLNESERNSCVFLTNIYHLLHISSTQLRHLWFKQTKKNDSWLNDCSISLKIFQFMYKQRTLFYNIFIFYLEETSALEK